MSAPVAAEGDHLEVGEVKRLIVLRKVGPRGTYDVSPDGTRILAVTRSAEASVAPLTLVTNRPALLRR